MYDKLLSSNVVHDIIVYNCFDHSNINKLNYLVILSNISQAHGKLLSWSQIYSYDVCESGQKENT